jgi:hypothetical protein
MLFRKRKKSGGPPPARRKAYGPAASRQERFEITFDMMEKGHIVKRRHDTIRQYTVMAGTRIHTVTSGDRVDRATLDALIGAGVVKAPQDTLEEPPGGGKDAPEDAP